MTCDCVIRVALWRHRTALISCKKLQHVKGPESTLLGFDELHVTNLILLEEGGIEGEFDVVGGLRKLWCPRAVLLKARGSSRI